MTYEFYKANINKLPPEDKERFALLGRKLELEHRAKTEREATIREWNDRAEDEYDGDTVGMLFDELKMAAERIEKLHAILDRKDTIIEMYQAMEPRRDDFA